MCLPRDQLQAQNLDAVLAVIVKLAGDHIFVKVLPGSLQHILRHPRSVHIAGLHWGLGTGVRWDVVGMGWDGWGWVLGMIVVAGIGD